MTWGEARRLSGLLVKDPSSQLAAALTTWFYPASRESLVLMDLYDAFAQANFKRPLPYPRPWDSPRRRFGQTSLTKDELRVILNEVRGVTSHVRDARGRLHDSRGRFVAEKGETRG